MSQQSTFTRTVWTTDTRLCSKDVSTNSIWYSSQVLQRLNATEPNKQLHWIFNGWHIN